MTNVVYRPTTAALNHNSTILFILGYALRLSEIKVLKKLILCDQSLSAEPLYDFEVYWNVLLSAAVRWLRKSCATSSLFCTVRPCIRRFQHRRAYGALVCPLRIETVVPAFRFVLL